MANAEDAANGHAYAAWLAQARRSSRATPLPVDPLVSLSLERGTGVWDERLSRRYRRLSGAHPGWRGRCQCFGLVGAQLVLTEASLAKRGRVKKRCRQKCH